MNVVHLKTTVRIAPSFVQQLQRSHKASQGGTRSAQKQSFSQSPELAAFTPAQRAGHEPTRR